MAAASGSDSTPSVVTSATTIVRTTIAALQLVLSTLGLKLPNYLIPTPLVAVSTPSVSIPLGGMAQPPLYTQSTSHPFSYGMPTVTVGSLGNFFANNMVPSMPMPYGNASCNFGPFQFGNVHIPLSNPSLGGSFIAQSGAQVRSILMPRSGFIPQPYTQFGSNVGIGLGFIP